MVAILLATRHPFTLFSHGCRTEARRKKYSIVPKGSDKSPKEGEKKERTLVQRISPWVCTWCTSTIMLRIESKRWMNWEKGEAFSWRQPELSVYFDRVGGADTESVRKDNQSMLTLGLVWFTHSSSTCTQSMRVCYLGHNLVDDKEARIDKMLWTVR